MNANQDLARAVTVERKAGASAEQICTVGSGFHPLIGGCPRLVEQIVKNLQPCVEHQKESHRRLIEDRAEKRLVLPQQSCRRLNLAEIIEHEGDYPALVGHAIGKRVEPTVF